MASRKSDAEAMRLFGPSRLRLPSPPAGLSARLLLITAGFALLTELLILTPSLAAFQERWLLERERAAEVATLAVDAAPRSMVGEGFARRLVKGAGVANVAVKTDVRRLLVRAPPMAETPSLVDLTRPRGLSWLIDPWRTLSGDRDRMIRAVARPRFRDGEFVEIVLPSEPLKQALLTFLVQSLAVSLAVSITAAAVVYLALSAFIVRPMRQLTLAIERFRADPEDVTAAPALSGRRDEIGRIEAELARMQEEVRQALRSRARLAALGEGVAKISHDLRNMLTSAQLASERLAASGDPKVAKSLPRLERALDRALGLAENVLNYGRSEEAPPQPRRFLLRPALIAAGEDSGLAAERVALEPAVAQRLQVEADPEQLHRVLVNLMRNARQAIEAAPDRQGRGRVRVSAARSGESLEILIEDDGPGVPEAAVNRLFQPFATAGRSGGAGLGLAISRELARAHGGDLTLARSDADGAAFLLTLPAPGRRTAPAEPSSNGRRVVRASGPDDRIEPETGVDPLPSS